MLDLPAIWSNRINIIAANLKFGEREHREVAATAQHVRWDYHGRFLIELIQNAADQAARAGLVDSEVLVVRTTELVAVLNQGRPLDDEGFRGLTSLAYDTKDPALSIGNKGLGFKAVFQVSEAPEIYSAPLEGRGLLVQGGYRFAFSQRPLEHEALDLELGRVADDFERSDPSAAEEIRQRYGGGSFREVLLAEAAHGAPFRFPLPRDETALLERISGLGLSGDAVAIAGALVVLPLKEGPEVQRWIDEAIGDLMGRADAATVLFLTGVGRIRCEDRHRGTTHVLDRRLDAGPVVVASGSRQTRVSYHVTSRSRLGPGENSDESVCRWCVCSRTLGNASDSDAKTAESESERILNAVAEFPGDHWARVSQATVDVALPLPPSESPGGCPLGTTGLFSIGLPTLMGTGTPLWVNARFHGSIARKEIDLAQNVYNQILFDEAIDLASDLVGALKAGDSPEMRRLATLAVESSGDGALGRAFREPGGLAHSEIVLSGNEVTFMFGRDVVMPREQDVDIFRLLSASVADPGYPFALPDELLMTNARALLRQLGGDDGPVTGPDQRYLTRDARGKSLIERGASIHRSAGAQFWELFLGWLLHQFPSALLTDQRVLPNGEDDLATVGDKVYAAPVFPESALTTGGDDESQRLDRVVARRLRLFDERCAAIREPDGVKYTRLGNQLRQTDPPMLREPALGDLVREVFGPHIQDLTAEPGHEREAIDLLGMVADWAHARGITTLPVSSLRVPTVGQNPDNWTWSAPTRVYFGEGWQDADTDALLALAYRKSPGRLLVPWSEFAAGAVADEDGRERWINALRTLGVSLHPRVQHHTHTSAPLQAYSYSGPLIRASVATCPIENAKDQWNKYIEAIRHRGANVSSAQSYDVEKLLWIDGLEVDEARQHVVALMLRAPQGYELSLTTKLSRSPGQRDSTEVPSLWAHALRNAGWRAIPTSHGLAAPNEAWLLSGEQRRHRRGRYQFLACVDEHAEPAQRLLLAIGVATPDDAPPERYVIALQDLAERLSGLRPEEMVHAIALAEEFYRELQRRLASNPVVLPILLERPLPMFDGIEQHRLFAVDLLKPPLMLVDDNHVRARFVEGVREAAVFPISPRRGHAALVAAIEAQTGEGSVSYTGRAPVQIDFEPNAFPETTVAVFLERAFRGHQLRRDIALILSVIAASSAEPSRETLRTVLRRFEIVRLRFGSFRQGAGTGSFFDDHDRLGPILLMDQSLHATPDRVFAETWQVFGAHRDLWASYAAVLRSGMTERFLAERGVTAADVRDIEAALDPARSTRFASLQPAVLAIGLASRAIAHVSLFSAEWSEHIASADDLARWIGREGLADTLALAASMDEQERASLYALEAAGVTVHEWQHARDLLGLPRHSFTRSRESYNHARAFLVAALMATAAHAVSVDLAEARNFIERIQGVDPDANLLHTPRTSEEMLPHLIGAAQMLLTSETAGTLTVLQARLREASIATDAAVEDALRASVSQREVDEYRLPEDARTASAERDVNIVLDAAQRLAPRFDEIVDATRVRDSGRVAVLAGGWWANRFTVLAALRQALEDVAPLTTRRLSDARAFHDPGPPGALTARITELSDSVPPPRSATPSPAARVVQLGGVRVGRDVLDRELAQGSDGIIGTELRRHAITRIDFDEIRRVEAGPLSSHRGRGGWSKGGGRSAFGGESQDDREINGLLGEAFVYELLREQLPGFDYQCWRSMNGVKYGVASEGDDALGADFIYRDLGGVLTGRADAPEVYLEVKATSSEGEVPFDISRNEWETAFRIHLEDVARVYAIVRVEHVRSSPALNRIFLDPVRLNRDGRLKVEWKDLRAYSAARLT